MILQFMGGGRGEGEAGGEALESRARLLPEQSVAPMFGPAPRVWFSSHQHQTLK